MLRRIDYHVEAGDKLGSLRWKDWAGLAILAILAVIGIILAMNTRHLAARVQEEIRTTPTPTPVYGSVMVVTPDPSVPTPEPVLKNGSVGELVTQLQSRLKALGYYAGEIDGQFGNGTRDAVVRFQTANSLDADGAVGPQTRQVLYSPGAIPADLALTATPLPTPSPSPEPSPAPTDAQAAGHKPYVRADGLPLLVNKTHPLPADYQPLELVELNAYCDTGVVKIKYSDTWAEREAVDALLHMLSAAVDDGITEWQISAAYRTETYQQQLLDKQINTYIRDNGMTQANARKAALKLVAEPGTSEHHLGTCFDITVPGQSFRGTKQHKWLAENCWDYGFILRYAENKEKLTGFTAEAWHYRYVGLSHAQIMRAEDLCLEEYIERYGDEDAVMLED